MFPFVITPTYLISVERYISELYGDTTGFLILSIKSELSLANHFISTQKDRMRVGKIVFKKDDVRFTETSVKERHSIDAKMNAESFECGYFP